MTIQTVRYSSLASEVGDTEVVGDVESVGSSDADWVLASTWDAGLALSSDGVVVGSSVTCEGTVYTIITLEVRSAKVVSQEESTASANASRILTTGRNSNLALSGL